MVTMVGIVRNFQSYRLRELCVIDNYIITIITGVDPLPCAHLAIVETLIIRKKA